MTENTQQTLSFGKEEKLCFEKSIDRLFKEGKSFVAYPLRVVYLIDKQDDLAGQLCKVLISVPKRKFKRANKRNRIKRLVREAYRLNKHLLVDALREKAVSVDVALIFLKDELPAYDEVEKGVRKMLLMLKNEIEKDEKVAD